VFHNFSQFGLISVDHCAADLVVIVEKPYMGCFVFQFDGQYVHGCPTCPPLTNYIGQQSHHQVRQTTKERNTKMHHWMSTLQHVFPTWCLGYYIIQDCHDEHGISWSLVKTLFQTVTELKRLSSPYQKLYTWIKQTKSSFLEVLLEHPADLTYFAIAKIKLQPRDTMVVIGSPFYYLKGHYIWFHPQEGWYWSNEPTHSVLLTPTLVRYLHHYFKVDVLSLDYILFFRACPF